MDSFQWNAAFSTGQAMVDEQHFYLVKLINQFGKLVVEHEVSLKKIDKAYTEIKEYMLYHFSEEEQLMRDVGIDGQFFEEHVQAHQEFMVKVELMRQQAMQHHQSESKYLSDFLTQWQVFHILGMDKKMTRQVEKINLGVCPKEAYQSEVNNTDSETEMLLSTLNSLFLQVSDRNQELVSLNRTLEHLSITDQLTGLRNRRFALSHLNALWKNSDKPIACLMIDADNFKIVNDNHGHDAGDNVLIELTRKLHETLRNDDVLCRLGGDEFLVLCENTDARGAAYLAKLLSDAVKTLSVPVGNDVWSGSVSIGIASRNASMSQYNQLIKVADQGLYLAKKSGKGCIKSV